MSFLCENFPDTDIIPARGDFSIVLNQNNRYSLTHDFDFIEKNNLWHIFQFRYHEIFPVKIFLRNNLCEIHDDTTFENNLFFLKFIYLNGWTEFIIRVLNCLKK